MPSKLLRLPPAAALLALVTALPAAAQSRDPARIAAAVDAPIQRALQSGRLAGATIAVVKGRDTLLMKTYGRADVEHDVPTPDRAVYEIGSLNQQFTAAAILQLQERGRLSLNDPIGRWLPDAPEAIRAIPLRRLMDHTSGIAGARSAHPEFQALFDRPIPRDSLVSLYGRKPLLFVPGTSISYSNTGYFILGMVIEKASGMPYDRYVRENLFARAGMRDSRYCGDTMRAGAPVRGYDSDGQTLRPAAHVDLRWPFSAGSLCATAGDLVAWTRALHGGRILSPAAYRQMTTPGALADGTPLRYAMGLGWNDVAGHRAIGHAGSIAGFSSQVVYFPDDTLTIVVLLNTLSPTVRPSEAVAGIARMVLGARPLAGVPLGGRAAEYAGDYRVPRDGGEVTLTFAADSAGGLTISPNGRGAYPLVYLGGDTFGREGDGTRWIFTRQRGRVTGVRVDDITESAAGPRVIRYTLAGVGPRRASRRDAEVTGELLLRALCVSA